MRMNQWQTLWPLLIVGILGLSGCGALVTTPPPVVHGSGSTSIANPYPTPQAQQAPLYSATLTQGTVGWASGPICAFGPRGLSVLPQQGQAYICLAPLATTSDFSASVTVRQMTGTTNQAFGIAFPHNDPKSYDFFGIDAHGRFTVTVEIADRCTTIIPFTLNAAIHPGLGSPNTLQVIVQGANATFFVNATPVGQATLSDFKNGSFGLRGINDGTTVFQDLVIDRV